MNVSAKENKKFLENILHVKFTTNSFYQFINTIIEEELNRLSSLGLIVDRNTWEVKRTDLTIKYPASFFYIFRGEIKDISYWYIRENITYYREIAQEFAKNYLTERERNELKEAYKLYLIEELLKETKKQPEKYILTDTKNTLALSYSLSDMFSQKEKRIRYGKYTSSLRRYFYYIDILSLEEKYEIKSEIKNIFERSSKIKYTDTKIRLLNIIEHI